MLLFFGGVVIVCLFFGLFLGSFCVLVFVFGSFKKKSGRSNQSRVE